MGGAPSRGPALTAANAKTTRDHAATRGRRAERPSPSPSSPLVAARRGRSVRRRGARGRVRATTPVRPRRLPRGARGERCSTAGSTSSSLAGPSRRTGGRATLRPPRRAARAGTAARSTTSASVARGAGCAAGSARGAEGATGSISPGRGMRPTRLRQPPWRAGQRWRGGAPRRPPRRTGRRARPARPRRPQRRPPRLDVASVCGARDRRHVWLELSDIRSVQGTLTSPQPHPRRAMFTNARFTGSPDG